jgi:putative FmdB family regulatory protein
MPTYEYECKKCGHRFEKFQSMKDAPEKKCPECRGPVRRLIGRGAAIIFKGSGFYETDYNRSGSRAPRCGRDSTCCGRDEPCEKRPCDD